MSKKRNKINNSKSRRKQYSSGRGRNNNEDNKLSNLSVERDLRDRGFLYIIGSDEAGRGAIAGPVVSASCCIMGNDLDDYAPIESVTGDSKALTAQIRQSIYNDIVSDPSSSLAWTIASCPNDQITEENNILKATMSCFQNSIESIVTKYDLLNKDNDIDDNNDPASNCSVYSIVDGNKTPKLTLGPAKNIPCRPWVKGDETVYTIALASVIAKVTRDEFMATEAHKLYPQYGFDANKGYSTKAHVEAIHKFGPCPLHRASFRAIKGR